MAPAPFSAEVRRLAVLALPLVISQVGSMMLWVVDVLMVGRLSVEALDAASLGRLWVMGTMILAMGMMLGLDPIATQAHGAGDRARLVRVGWNGLGAALGITPILAVLWLATAPVLELLGQSPEIAAAAASFVHVQIPGIPCFLGYIVLRHWLQAQGIMRPLILVTLAANVVNFGGNWLLIYGKLGLPALGVVGSGLSTCITMVFLFVGAALVVRVLDRERREWHRPHWREIFDPAAIGRILRLGLPVGVQFGLEYWAFGVSMLWAGWLGLQELAGHTIAINLASLAFTLPMGISFATVTRVGNQLGAGDPPGAQRAAWASAVLTLGVMGGIAGIFVLGRVALPGIYTADPVVLALAAGVMPIAAAFQLFDGLQAIGGGILRGMGRTIPAAVFNLLGYWTLGLPLGWWLTFRAGWGLPGLWWGLTAGLAAVAALLMAWIAWRGPATMVVAPAGAGHYPDDSRGTHE
ncbi:MAG: MATE family efflux transporter [Thermoanaerobaculia bacterium]|nr:MATE family efflux transporter [Thermoanaerobaculia bacterium]